MHPSRAYTGVILNKIGSNTKYLKYWPRCRFLTDIMKKYYESFWDNENKVLYLQKQNREKMGFVIWRFDRVVDCGGLEDH